MRFCSGQNVMAETDRAANDFARRRWSSAQGEAVLPCAEERMDGLQRRLADIEREITTCWKSSRSWRRQDWPGSMPGDEIGRA
jgi:hypothetical protein